MNFSVRHNAAGSRFEVEVDGLLSVCEYEDSDRQRVFTHTFVPADLRGRGIAEALVQAALAESRAAGLKVVPACSYVARFIARNREWQDLVTS